MCVHVRMCVCVHACLVDVTKQPTCMKGAWCTNKHFFMGSCRIPLWVMGFIHVGCLVTSTKSVVTHSQATCRAHAVLSIYYYVSFTADSTLAMSGVLYKYTHTHYARHATRHSMNL